MSEPITLPGEIPGLVRKGSTVCKAPPDSDRQYCVIGNIGTWLRAIPSGNGGMDSMRPAAELLLDLSDPTSRIHAAWWVIERGPVTDEEHVILFTVKNNGHLNRAGQEQLRDMVLRRYNRSQT